MSLCPTRPIFVISHLKVFKYVKTDRECLYVSVCMSVLGVCVSVCVCPGCLPDMAGPILMKFYKMFNYVKTDPRVSNCVCLYVCEVCVCVSVYLCVQAV